MVSATNAVGVVRNKEEKAVSGAKPKELQQEVIVFQTPEGKYELKPYSDLDDFEKAVLVDMYKETFGISITSKKELTDKEIARKNEAISYLKYRTHLDIKQMSAIVYQLDPSEVQYDSKETVPSIIKTKVSLERMIESAQERAKNSPSNRFKNWLRGLFN